MARETRYVHLLKAIGDVQFALTGAYGITLINCERASANSKQENKRARARVESALAITEKALQVFGEACRGS